MGNETLITKEIFLFTVHAENSFYEAISLSLSLSLSLRMCVRVCVSVCLCLSLSLSITF